MLTKCDVNSDSFLIGNKHYFTLNMVNHGYQVKISLCKILLDFILKHIEKNSSLINDLHYAKNRTENVRKQVEVL